ncbi:hypothetical protein VR7878_03088 [Vibrio ruber DSM 16370]|uniref:Uncharacterized protein n=1 Tax=Vibrio ruber (strain DSM 16370 / JCM 11486 / BCRC 17186 / CECT 7878 / LMG 23124 / VR1) TaxID=1123498 RepID=A0A1R4LQI7_VIBR1|nr:hypothetical protein VR7878_03088 [Vibrio ruber DSM 16370]
MSPKYDEKLTINAIFILLVSIAESEIPVLAPHTL